MTLSPVHVSLSGGRSYDVRFDVLEAAPRHLADVGLEAGRALVISDETVAALHLGRLRAALEDAGWTLEVATVPPGEGSKSVETWSGLLDWALGLGIDRGTPVLALGGGVVGDLGGFASASLLRGLPLVHLPTTTISQVDSAIGGKTGINHATGKNLIGAFHQPRLVLADPTVLETLPPRDYRSGLAEAVKHALISDAGFARRLEDEWEGVVSLDLEIASPLIRDAAAVKAEVVSDDEFEAGRRALLNFGHTFGHALERVAGYGALTHGEAVAIGMRAAVHLSESLRIGRVAPSLGAFEDADSLVQRLAPPAPALEVGALMEAMGTDKKRTASGLRFVVLEDVGAARLAGDVPETFVRAAWDFALSG